MRKINFEGGFYQNDPIFGRVMITQTTIQSQTQSINIALIDIQKQ